MTIDWTELRTQMQEIVQEWKEALSLRAGSVIVIGCSTSEVIGEKIGTSGTMEVAQIIFEELQKYAKEEDCFLAFQCCEHLNRALVVEREIADRKGWEIVSVIPVRDAGGSMATYAYQHFQDPVVVEFIEADAGMDIGDTLIGMHLKHVAVPVRISHNRFGNAHLTLATTRPKLIGGARAVYES